MTDVPVPHAAPSNRLWRVAALLWLLAMCGVAAHQWQFWQQGRFQSDVMALLPVDEQEPAVTLAVRQLADAATREVVAMLGTPDWVQTRQAVARWREAMHGAALTERSAPDAEQMSQALDFYLPWRDRLLTATQRDALQRESPERHVEAALAALYQPAVRVRLSDWAADPLGLWPQWWTARAAESAARPRDGLLAVEADGQHWAVLRYEIAGSGFSLTGEATYGDALQAASAAASSAVPGLRVMLAGVPLHAEAAAVQAGREIRTIGWGSLTAVLLLVWLTFRAPRPIVLVGLSLLVGCATALSVTAWVFHEVHLMTLVFGACLVGVAQDYGFHYFASRQGHPDVAPRSLMSKLLPALLLAMLTSVVAYLALGVAAFPGLRQMALFSAVGLIATLLCVVLWFPLIDRGEVRRSRFADLLGGSLARFPRLSRSPVALVAWLLVAVLCGVGLLQLGARDDVRQLQNSPAGLIAQQRDVGRLLGLPSPAQFFLVRGDSADQVLEREEALRPRLDALVADGAFAGYGAVSDWVPSVARQRADAERTAQVEQAVLDGINQALGEEIERPAFAADALTLEAWLAHAVSQQMRPLWLGQLADGSHASVILLRGLNDVSRLPELRGAAEGLDGVRWVDKPTEISELLARYRLNMSALLLVGHLAVLAVLLVRYRQQAWRVWLPVALATVLTLGVLGLFGQPLQLFNVLAFTLLLGVGIDYGIFLLEHRGDGAAWLAVLLGAASTWLAFGLLALSGTPALHAFGLTLIVGLACVAFLAPLFRAAAAPVVSPSV